MDNDKVVQIPDKFTRLANRIQKDLKKMVNNKEEWIEIQVDIATALWEARTYFIDDREFGNWCVYNGFGENVINKDDRAAYIKMGENPDNMREILLNTDRTSIRLIYKDNAMFRSVAKHQKENVEENKKPEKPKKTPEEKAKEAEAKTKEAEAKAEEKVKTAKINAEANRIKYEDQLNSAKIKAKISFIKEGGTTKNFDENMERMEQLFERGASSFMSNMLRTDFPISMGDLKFARVNLHPDHFKDLTYEEVTRISSIFNALYDYIINHNLIKE